MLPPCDEDKTAVTTAAAAATTTTTTLVVVRGGRDSEYKSLLADKLARHKFWVPYFQLQ